jgi:hypothetical protein
MPFPQNDCGPKPDAGRGCGLERDSEASPIPKQRGLRRWMPGGSFVFFGDASSTRGGQLHDCLVRLVRLIIPQGTSEKLANDPQPPPAGGRASFERRPGAAPRELTPRTQCRLCAEDQAALLRLLGNHECATCWPGPRDFNQGQTNAPQAQSGSRSVPTSERSPWQRVGGQARI